MSALQIGPYRLGGRACLAPMAGITDPPFRRLCRSMGAALAAGEMLSADPRLWPTEESRRRRDHSGEMEPRVVQIAGGDPRMMADAALRNVDAGAQVIDVNMGCPAKRVCNKEAGSALLRDERLVAAILEATVRAAGVPVTLKMRTGWDPFNRNGVAIARIAESCGVTALAVHGRTRACRLDGPVEYRTIAAIKQAVAIPVIANGDIDSADMAATVLASTGADGIMIGRAAQGRPWIFREVEARLACRAPPPEPTAIELRAIMTAHLRDLYAFHGVGAGVRVARKHIGWYCRGRPQALAFRQSIMQAETTVEQLARVHEYCAALEHQSAVAA